MKNQKKFLFLIFLIFISLTWFFLYLKNDFLQINQLNIYAAFIFDFIDNNYFIAFLIYTFSYALFVSINFPLGSVLSILGGFFFDIWMGSLAIIIGSSMGATFVFIIVRYFFKDYFEKKIYSKKPNLKKYFDKNSTLLMLLIRLVPVLPYSVQNFFLASSGVNLSKFYITTVIGQTPWSIIYASIGMGLNELIISDIDISKEFFSNADYFIPMILIILIIVLILFFHFLEE